MEHTPGDWRFNGHDGVVSERPEHSTTEYPNSLLDDDPHSLEYYGGYLICESVREGNAHLISAAPDMEQALSPFAARYHRIIREGERPLKVLVPFQWLKEAAAAIAKAKGERQP